MIKAILVDDEKKSRENLEAFLNRLGGKVEIIGEAENADRAFEEIKDKQPHLVFLDVEMPGGSGFDLLSRFDELKFEVIFVTAYSHYAINAIKFSALGYITKPINIEELTEAVDKAIKTHEDKNKTQVDAKLMHELIDSLKGKEKLRKLFIPEMSGFTVLETKTILYCKSEGNYTEIITEEEKIVCSKSLKDFQEALPAENFYRINKSYIINSGYIYKYRKGSGGTVVMTNKHEIDVPRRSKEEFMKFMDQSRRSS